MYPHTTPECALLGRIWLCSPCNKANILTFLFSVLCSPTSDLQPLCISDPYLWPYLWPPTPPTEQSSSGVQAEKLLQLAPIAFSCFIGLTYFVVITHQHSTYFIIMLTLLCGLCNQIPSSAHSSVVWGHVEFWDSLEWFQWQWEVG